MSRLHSRLAALETRSTPIVGRFIFVGSDAALDGFRMMPADFVETDPDLAPGEMQVSEVRVSFEDALEMLD